jgi:hypothetical protein
MSKTEENERHKYTLGIIDTGLPIPKLPALDWGRAWGEVVEQYECPCGRRWTCKWDKGVPVVDRGDCCVECMKKGDFKTNVPVYVDIFSKGTDDG